MLKPLALHKGIVIPFNRSDIDTDALLPKQYLKKLEKVGFGNFLFDDERFSNAGDVDTPLSERIENPEFILNREPYRHGSVVLAQKNFGCGSSREHAVWALRDFGVRVLLAPSYGEIFYSNCFNNGLLPIVLPQAEIDALFAAEKVSSEGFQLTIDVRQRSVHAGDQVFYFELSESRQQALLKGMDLIAETLEYAAKIREYERINKQKYAWLFAEHGL
ncbi:3-isopropylmalate dehydratase small subunit [Pseudidiomarina gelatinasegens]|uniref:3-isopropylmalate dehydratase small subunit n=1 Tax=Pseudidiomarina gelatinasegens TaxID=2487740 RepID=UPI003A96B54D